MKSASVTGTVVAPCERRAVSALCVSAVTDLRYRRQGRRGVALIVVLWVIMVLSLLIGGFAFTMHVETQVASLSRKETKAKLLARSGIEVAQMTLVFDSRSAGQGAFDALNQNWVTNTDLFVEHQLGEGKFNVTIMDEERKIPINRCSEEQLRESIGSLGLEQIDSDTITDSILDWTDENNLHRLHGAEDDYYMSLVPPYHCKDKPLDRVEELLLIRGVTPDIYYGSLTASTNSTLSTTFSATGEMEAMPGFADLFTTMTAGAVNVNTASRTVLQVWLGLDEAQADAIILHRDGTDGVSGTDDDIPFRSADEFLGMLGGLDAKAKQRIRPLLTVQSTFFTIKCTGEIGNVKRTIIATVRRQGQNVSIVSWREMRGGGT